MVKSIAITVFMLCSLTASAAMTLIHREFFTPLATNNVAAMNSTNLGSFSAIVGSLQPIAVGPKLTNTTGLGWSARAARITNYGVLTNATSFGFACGWFRFSRFGETEQGAVSPTVNDDPARFAYATDFLYPMNANAGIQVGVDSSRTLYCNTYYGATPLTNCGTLNPSTWYFIGIAWQYVNPNVSFRVYVATKADIALGNLPIVAGRDSQLSSSPVTFVRFGNYSAPAGTGWSGRMGAVSLYSITSFSDVAYPADVVPPPDDRTVWHLNPSTGSDLNDGTTPTSAWASAGKLLTEIWNGGIMANPAKPWMRVSDLGAVDPHADPIAFNNGIANGTICAGGDRVLIDTSTGAPLQTTNSFYLDATNDGIEIGATNGRAAIMPLKTLSGPYSAYSGSFPHIWTTSDTEAGAILYEDLKWLNSPLGVDITAVRTNLESTAGSYWTSGATLYFHPFGDTDPNSDGKTYQRTRLLWSAGLNRQTHTVWMSGTNNRIFNLNIWGDAYRDATNGVASVGYVVDNDSQGCGVVDNCDLRYGGNHSYGSIISTSTNFIRLVYNTTIEQSAPYPESGAAQSVEYSSADTPGIRRAYYWLCDMSIAGVIGSTNGISTNGVQYSHGAVPASTPQYALYDLWRCKGYVTMNTPIFSSVTIRDCDVWSLNAGPVAPVVTGSTIRDWMQGYAGANFTNSVIQYKYTKINILPVVTNSWRFSNCTFDATAIPNPDSVVYAPIVMAENNFLTNCVVLLPQMFNASVFPYTSQFTNSADHNVFQLSPAGIVASDRTGSGGTFKTMAQWQALGNDAHSVAANACLGSGYRPYAKTPTWTTGTEVGPLIDFTGKLFQSRHTAGAYEFQVLGPAANQFP